MKLFFLIVVCVNFCGIMGTMDYMPSITDISCPSPVITKKPITNDLNMAIIAAVPAENYVVTIATNKQSQTSCPSRVPYIYRPNETDGYLIVAFVTGFLGWSSLYCMLTK